MVNQITAFVKKHMTTRRKEVVFGLLFSSVWLIMTSGICPTIFWTVVICLIFSLTMATGISLTSPFNEKERLKQPLFIKLALRSKEKNGWMIFLVFLALVAIDVVFSSLLPKSDTTRYILIALIGFSSVIFWELLHVWRKI
jgi:hypothetical protein